MPEMHLEYSMQVKNQFESLIDEGEETTWEAMRDILIETAENISLKEKKRKTKMDDRGDFINDGRQAEVKSQTRQWIQRAGQTNQKEM